MKIITTAKSENRVHWAADLKMAFTAITPQLKTPRYPTLPALYKLYLGTNK